MKKKIDWHGNGSHSGYDGADRLRHRRGYILSRFADLHLCHLSPEPALYRGKGGSIFTKAFADDGIEVKYAEITSGADQTQALAAGDVQVLYAVGATSVILSAANDADIKVLNMYSRSPKAFCMYSKDESISSPADFARQNHCRPCRHKSA